MQDLKLVGVVECSDSLIKSELEKDGKHELLEAIRKVDMVKYLVDNSEIIDGEVRFMVS